MLVQALSQFGDPPTRQERPTGDDPQFRWINYSASKGRKGGPGAMLACEFISYTQGANLGAINFALNVAHYAVDELPPPQGKEYLEGSVYFGVLDNHVVAVQSAALKTKDLEKHLNWFLRQRSQVLHEDNAVSLDDNLPAGASDLSDAQGLELAAPVHFQPAGSISMLSAEEITAMKKAQKKAEKKGGKEEPGESSAVAKESVRVVPVGRAWDAVKAFFGDGFNLPAINAEDMLKSGQMKVSLALSWSNPRGKDASDFVRDVAHKFRHISDEIDYRVKTASGYIGKDKFKPEKPCSVRWGKVRPDFDDVFPKMLEWLENLERRGIIRA